MLGHVELEVLDLGHVFSKVFDVGNFEPALRHMPIAHSVEVLLGARTSHVAHLRHSFSDSNVRVDASHTLLE